MDCKIKPFVGFDRVKFGQKIEEVTKVLGQPSSIDADQNYSGEPNETEELTTVLSYDELGVIMSFEKAEGYRLTEISFEDERYALGKLKVGMPKAEALKAAEALKLGEYDENFFDDDEDSEGYETYDYTDKNVCLWFFEGALDAIQIGPDFDDNGEIVWP